MEWDQNKNSKEGFEGKLAIPFLGPRCVDVVRFLKILTFLSMEEINELEERMKRPGYIPNSAQRSEEGLLESLKATEALRPGAETLLDWKTKGLQRNEDVPCVWSRSLEKFC
uniref:Uncharacterized protein n=1 Tax=Nelumbo nucifera TaxID=4432 RepID=A0A822XQT7_NELNU|nr:TPA_asm: hypothetical protein HUJ06_022779 [Nelumbo nucifera]